HRDLDRLVELHRRTVLEQPDGLIQGIGLVGIDALAGLRNALRYSCHRRQPTTSRPIERAEPSTMRMAASTSLALRSFIFASAISRTLSRDTVPATVLPGSFEPDFRLAAFFRK